MNNNHEIESKTLLENCYEVRPDVLANAVRFVLGSQEPVAQKAFVDLTSPFSSLGMAEKTISVLNAAASRFANIVLPNLAPPQAQKK